MPLRSVPLDGRAFEFWHAPVWTAAGDFSAALGEALAPFTPDEVSRMRDITAEEVAVLPDLVPAFEQILNVNTDAAKLLFQLARRTRDASRVVTTGVRTEDPLEKEEVEAKRREFVRAVMVLKLFRGFEPDVARLLVRLTRSRGEQFCRDVVLNLPTLRDDAAAREWVLASSDGFFDRANRLPVFLDTFPVDRVPMGVFTKCSAIPDVTTREIVEAVREAGEDAAAVIRIARKTRVSIPRAAAVPAAKKRARLDTPCELCGDDAECDMLGCSRKPSMQDGNKVDAKGNPVKISFSCGAEFGHMCKACTVPIAQKALLSRKMGVRKDGDTIHHFPFEWTLFQFEDAAGVVHTVDATTNVVVCPTLALARHTFPSSVKVGVSWVPFVHTHTDARCARTRLASSSSARARTQRRTSASGGAPRLQCGASTSPASAGSASPTSGCATARSSRSPSSTAAFSSATPPTSTLPARDSTARATPSRRACASRPSPQQSPRASRPPTRNTPGTAARGSNSERAPSWPPTSPTAPPSMSGSSKSSAPPSSDVGNPRPMYIPADPPFRLVQLAAAAHPRFVPPPGTEGKAREYADMLVRHAQLRAELSALETKMKRMQAMEECVGVRDAV